jgi:hypothetical protein
VAQQQVLEDEVLARANRGKEGNEQEPEEFEHVLSIVDQAVRGFATPTPAAMPLIRAHGACRVNTAANLSSRRRICRSYALRVMNSAVIRSSALVSV